MIKTAILAVLLLCFASSVILDPLPDSIILNSSATTTVEADLRTTGSVSIVGNYTAVSAGSRQITLNISVTINSDSIGVKGCNTNNAGYTGNYPYINVSFFISTRIYCAQDQDSLVTSGFTNAVRVSRSGDFLIFYNQAGTEVLRLRSGSGSGNNGSSPIVSLEGRYIGMFTGLPNLELTIDGSRISFRGCNSNSLPYQARANGQFNITGPGISTLIACQVDNDSKYVQAITSANGYRRVASLLYLTRNGQTIITLNQATNSTNPPTSSRVNLDGNYSLAVTGSNLIGYSSTVINGSVLSFEGCNRVQVNYEAFSNGTFRVTGSAVLTRRQCFENFDDQIINAISSANTFTRNQSDIFLNRNGQRVVSLKSSRPTDTNVSLAGSYRLVFTDSQLPLIAASVTATTISFSGCNSVSFAYEARSSGTFRSTGPATTTLKFCTVDYDSKYIAAIQSADTYSRVGARLFLTRNGQRVVEFIPNCN